MYVECRRTAVCRGSNRQVHAPTPGAACSWTEAVAAAHALSFNIIKPCIPCRCAPLLQPGARTAPAACCREQRAARPCLAPARLMCETSTAAGAARARQRRRRRRHVVRSTKGTRAARGGLSRWARGRVRRIWTTACGPSTSLGSGEEWVATREGRFLDEKGGQHAGACLTRERAPASRAAAALRQCRTRPLRQCRTRAPVLHRCAHLLRVALGYGPHHPVVPPAPCCTATAPSLPAAGAWQERLLRAHSRRSATW
jgi:hypothetical protein